MARALSEAFIRLRPDDTGFKADADSQIKRDLDGVKGQVKVTLADDKVKAGVTDLKARLADLGRRATQVTIGANDKDANLALARIKVALGDLDKRVAKPKIDLQGIARADAQILALDLKLDALNKKSTGPNFLTKAAGAGALKPSGVGTALALSPTLIPVAASVAGAVGAIGVAFGAAAFGAGAFGLLAKSALTTAGTAASAVQTANDQYKTSLVAIHQQYAANAAAATTHAQKAAALATEQKALTTAGIAQTKAINTAYAQMTPAQIRLSKAIGGMQNAWHGVQQSTTPLISGALVPWIKTVESLMKDIKPFVAPVADMFRAWGQSLQRYFSSSRGSAEIHRIAHAVGEFASVQLGYLVQFFEGIAKGIWHLGSAATGATQPIINVGAHLAAWGNDFAQWSKSKQARDDVQHFMAWLSGNGHTLASIARDLAKFIPGIFAGASAAGTLELRALSSLLGLLAKLPPSIAKPLTEIAGAALLLSKTGVLKVGLTLAGKAWDLLKGGSLSLGGDAAAAAMRAAFATGGSAAAAEMRAALAGGGAASGGEAAAGGAAGEAGAGAAGGAGGIAAGILSKGPLIAAGGAIALGIVLKFREDLKSGVMGVLADIPRWFSSVPLGPIAVSAQGWADTALNHFRRGILHGEDIARHNLASWFDEMRHNFSGWWDDIGKATDVAWNTTWNNTIGRLNRGRHDVAHGLDDLRHSTANVFDGVRHDIASAWNTTWSNTAGRAQRGIAAVGGLFGGWRHNLSGWFDTTRHAIASAWDAIWNSTAGRVRSGIGTAEKLFSGWWNNIGNWLGNARRGIAAAWNTIWNNTVSRVSSGVGAVVGWFRKMPGEILGALRGLGHSLANFARAAFSEMWDAFKNVGGSIINWAKGFFGGLVHDIGKFLHMSPPHAGSAFYDLGANMMNHLEAGIKSKAESVRNATQGVAGGAQPTGSGATNEALMKSMAASIGWTGAQWQALFNVEMREAGFSMTARNPSGAYGMAQFIGGPSEYYQYGGNPNTARGQITGMINYIRQRYINPERAWAHELAFGWYGKGLHGGIFDRPTLIGVGERGPERVDVTPLTGARGRSGGGVTVNMYGTTIRENADISTLARKLDFRVQTSWMG